MWAYECTMKDLRWQSIPDFAKALLAEYTKPHSYAPKNPKLSQKNGAYYKQLWN